MLLAAVISTVQTYVFSAFINEEITSLGNYTIILAVIYDIFLLISAIGASFFVAAFSELVRIKIDIRIGSSFEDAILDKRSRLAYSVIENSESCELINRVSTKCNSRIISGYTNIMSIANYLIRIFGIVALVMTGNWLLGIVTGLLILRMIPIAKKCGEEDYRSYEKAEENYRRARYFRRLLSEREYVDERTQFNFSAGINEKWHQKFTEARKFNAQATKKNHFKIKLAGVAGSVIACGIVGALAPIVASGNMTTGLYISIVGAVFTLINLMSWEIARVIETYISNQKYLSDFNRFLRLPEVFSTQGKGLEITEHSVNCITFRDVSFVYPQTQKKILNHLSFQLEKGKIYFLVGVNGAGKTTIVNILLGLYDNYEGEVLLNNVNIRCMCPEYLFRLFSVVYQDFAKYELSIYDNIILGCRQREDNDSLQNVNPLLDKLGLWPMIDSMPEGISTHIGQLSETARDLSGGEWQRIAITRAMIRQSPIQILDEPTAAMDPLAEKDLYDLFLHAFSGDIGILITHRLGGIRNVDEILVIHNGQVCEQGSHDELMRKAGLYAEMFQTQRNWHC